MLNRSCSEQELIWFVSQIKSVKKLVLSGKIGSWTGQELNAQPFVAKGTQSDLRIWAEYVSIELFLSGPRSYVILLQQNKKSRFQGQNRCPCQKLHVLIQRGFDK